ncbi:cell surface protein [Corynebacterium diphtheriae]|uniref:cell surface protein n=1 Tax=Corynebacterium diphtheriae TaxID=1717 RepID=UPI00092C66E9|nr:cell surface protein [Corynebacterium diphtheriae]MBG9247240.1 cell surface protein [Corynebacterium diphtheriae bv. mitis]MBG9271193.1 cell surface protein [Corynebacterium diphtheriae bv. gravis]MBG9345389.1 cell surface protein [Corynebacterium diphtheriae bv. gravis]MBG9352353.1 cell surface protein [Corynebacterium diphtheriae bv. gravis]OJH92914.1 cell surface protein [Corynebacterium diphtheriae]
MNKQMTISPRGWRIAIPTASAAFAVALTATLGLMGADTTLPQAQAAVTGFYKPAPPADTIDLNREVTMVIKIPSASGNTDKGAPGYKVTITRLETAPINTNEGYTKAAALSVAEAQKLKKLESHTGVTDSEGKYEFTGLKPGAYLFTAEPPSAGGRKPQADVIIVPIIDEHGQWDYNFTAVAKFEVEPEVPPVTLPPTVTTTVTPPPTPTTVTPPPGVRTETPPKTKAREPLPVTGAQVIGIVGIAIALISFGAFLILSPRRKTQSR